MKELCFAILTYCFAAIAVADVASSKQRVLIDVRTPAEYAGGHVPGALNINFDKIGTGIAEITTDKDQAIHLYCKSGRRAGFAKQALEQIGYSHVVNSGGINDVLQRTNTMPQTGLQ